VCKAQHEGGQRCAAHTRALMDQRAAALNQKILSGQAVEDARRAWEDAAVDYASTRTGRRVLEESRAAAKAAGEVHTVAMLTTILMRGEAVREANLRSRTLLKSAEGGPREAGNSGPVGRGGPGSTDRSPVRSTRNNVEDTAVHPGSAGTAPHTSNSERHGDDPVHIEELAAQLRETQEGLNHHQAEADRFRALVQPQTTRLAIARDIALAAQEGRETCGFRLGNLDPDNDYREITSECVKPLGHEDEHQRSDGETSPRSLDYAWIQQMDRSGQTG
jgi:hypothetical protein